MLQNSEEDCARCNGLGVTCDFHRGVKWGREQGFEEGWDVCAAATASVVQKDPPAATVEADHALLSPLYTHGFFPAAIPEHLLRRSRERRRVLARFES